MKYFIIFLFVLLTAHARADSASDTTYSASLSVIPFTKWSILPFGQYDKEAHLNYSFNDSYTVSYDANFAWKLLSLGGSASSSNSIVKFSRYLGYLGISNVSMKYTQLKLSGSCDWDGLQSYDMKPNFNFDNRIRFIDIVYTGGDDFKWIIGAGYTTFSFPLDFSVRKNVYSGSRYRPTGGSSFYDDSFTLKMYGIVAGIDTLKNKPEREGFMWFILSQDRFNIIGKGYLSRNAIERSKSANPGFTPIAAAGNHNDTPFQTENETAIGLRYDHLFEGGWISFAVGYDLVWGGIMVNSEGTAANMSQWAQNIFYVRQGVIARISGTW